MIGSRTAASRTPTAPATPAGLPPGPGPARPLAEPGSYQGQGADSGTPEIRAATGRSPQTNACGHRPIQVRRLFARVCCRGPLLSAASFSRRHGLPGHYALPSGAAMPAVVGDGLTLLTASQRP